MSRRPSDDDEDNPQNGLFDDVPESTAEAHARRTDPGTSKLAARVMEISGKAMTIRDAILVDVQTLKGHGITTFEFSEAHPEFERVSVSPRFTSLFRERRIGKRGSRHRPGQTDGATSMIHVLPMYANEMYGAEDEARDKAEAAATQAHTAAIALPPDDEPKPNSPEDLGLVTPTPDPKPPEPEPEPTVTNHAPGVAALPDMRIFVDWLVAQGIPIDRRVSAARCMIVFSGFIREDLKWLCQACRKAGRVPRPETMRKAALARDVAVLRPGGDLETTQKDSG